MRQNRELEPVPVESSFSEKKLAYKAEGRTRDIKKAKTKTRRDTSLNTSTRRKI